jgi:Ras-related protein Rab-22
MSAYKIMLLGEIGVGKSSIARRLVFDRFETDYKPTIGVDVFRYVVEATADRPAVTFIVWDTDGNFGESIFRHVYMRDAAAALIVGDAGRPDTFDTMAALGRGFAESMPGRYYSYVVNKADLVPGGAASLELPELLRSTAVPLHIVSARTGSRIKDCFSNAASAVVRRNAAD